MRLLAVFLKSLREQWRDKLALSLTLVFAPCMVFLYWLFFPGGSTTYAVLVLNNDVPVQMEGGATLSGGKDVVDAIKHVTYADAKPLLVTHPVGTRSEAEVRLRNHDGNMLLIIPPDFSRTMLATTSSAEPASSTVTFVGDLTNTYYAPVAVMVGAAVDEYVQAVIGLPRPVVLKEEPLQGSGARSEFENYVPGLLVFAVIMLVFQASMVVVAEVEAGTLRRLQLTRMTSLDLLGGTGAALVLVGILSLLLAFAAAVALGFHSQGPLWVAIAVGALTSLSVIGVGLMVACFSRTVNQAFLIANFPLAIFMFFSGSAFPMPRITLFYLGGHSIGLYDILPPTHAVTALHKVLTLGRGLGDVLYEMTALVILSLVFFAAGVWLFQRTHLKAS